MRRGAACAAALLLLAGCGSGGDDKAVVTVFAAASLTESFGRIEARFEAAEPGIDVRFNFAGSSALAQQIANGAAADAFASADEATMAKVADRVDGQARVFATNRLAIVVPKGNPAGVKGLADLARGDVTTVVCAPQVPCGAAAVRAAGAAGLTLRPASEEQDVKAVLTKVASGEADAGLVYASDVRAAGERVEGIGFPKADGVVNAYPIAVLEDAPNADAARRFADFVLGPQGRELLAEAGFGPP